MQKRGLQVTEVSFLGKGSYSFSLAPGECVGLSGNSGIGKSQLFRAITDLIQLSGGEITLQGINKDEIDAPTWRKRVTLVVTDSAWWYEQVGDHFDPGYVLEKLPAYLTQLGLPLEVTDWFISRLSTGEKQRLSLLRSLQNSPEVLLLDEPTSGLDPHHARLMEKFIGQIQREYNLAVMWVSHDPEQLRRVADRVLVMKQDSIVVQEREQTK